MISIELARDLREAGLMWEPREHDRFAMPDREMDGQIFVVSGLPAQVQRIGGHPVVAFQGSVEWALDYVLLTEALWLPSEAQLRTELAARVPPHATMRLERIALGYRCDAEIGGVLRGFDGPDAETAYGLALIAALEAGATTLAA